MFTRAWKIYGREGHRQRESFNGSTEFTTWRGEKITVLNADTTGTHDYSILVITAPTAEDAENAMLGQVSDGTFENSRTGKLEEIRCSVDAWLAAEAIRVSGTWPIERCKELCAAAGLGEAWEASDGDSFERIVSLAAEILGVDVF